MKMKYSVAALAAAMTLTSANAAILLNFGGNQSAVSQTVGAANGAGINSSTGWTDVTVATDAVGVTDGARTVTWASANTWGGGAAAGLTGDAAMMNTWLDDGGLTVTLAGLTIGDSVTIYGSSDSGNGARTLGWAVDGADNYVGTLDSGAGLNANGDYHDGYGGGNASNYTFIATAATHTITAATGTTGTNRSGVAGIEITAVPEPSSTALLGLGGLALILRRRK